MAKYIREPSPFNTQIVSLGVDTYLKMLLADNFVHTDLHPGNIMVRIRGVSHRHKPWSALPLQHLFFFLFILFFLNLLGYCFTGQDQVSSKWCYDCNQLAAMYRILGNSRTKQR